MLSAKITFVSSCPITEITNNRDMSGLGQQRPIAGSQNHQLLSQRLNERLRGYELRLLRCSFCHPEPLDTQPMSSGTFDLDSLNLHSRISDVLNLIETGNYFEVLSSNATEILRELLVSDSSSSDQACELLVELVEKVCVHDSNGVDDEKRICRLILLLCVAVAALFCFVQCNITGPLDKMPQYHFPSEVLDVKEAVDWDIWACKQFISHGADLFGKFSNLKCLAFAKILLMGIKDVLFRRGFSSTYAICTVSWWLGRLLLVQQRILAELSASLFDLLQVCMTEALNHFGTPEKVTCYWLDKVHEEESHRIVSMVHLEAGIVDYTYGRVDSCRLHFESAKAAAGLSLSISGVLGYRTVHQAEPKAQGVLIINTGSSENIAPYDSFIMEEKSHRNKTKTCELSDVLKLPILLEDSNEAGARASSVPLKPFQQAVILAQCLLIKSSIRHDEMQGWDMAPFIEAVDAQKSSCFTLRYFCDLLRVRWEATRSHSKMRALEMMKNLIEDAHNDSPGPVKRIPFCFLVDIPTVSTLKKEYGELLVSFGLIGEAIEIFESLELWDNLIHCNCLLGKKAAAIELVRKRLSKLPNDPRLWCSLGDITNDDNCYRRALEVSNNKSARAMRSLARNAYNRGNYESSKIFWDSAMALNSLFQDGWFALGAAALKARDVKKALDAFVRAIQLDPENGEAWNNIACLHLINKRKKEAFFAFKEALKFKRNSWQMWENFSHVALDVGDIRQALEGVQMVLRVTKFERIDVELLEKAMLEIERLASKEDSACSTDTKNETGWTISSYVDLDANVKGSRETKYLVEFLGKILQQIVKHGCSSEMWGLYARWHKLRGDLLMCSESLLKQVRSYQGSDLWKDKDRFRKYTLASLQLCNLYMQISSSTGSRRELMTAEMHLTNAVRQAERFSDMQEFSDLHSCLEEVKMKLRSQALPAC